MRSQARRCREHCEQTETILYKHLGRRTQGHHARKGRKGRERLRDLGILPAGHPKQKWGPGCLWFGNLGRRGLGEESPYPRVSGILLTSSGQSRVGRGPWERAGRAPPPMPNSDDRGRVEGAGLLLLLPRCPAPPGFFSLTGLEQGNSPSSRPGKLFGHSAHLCKPGGESPSSWRPQPLPGRRGLIHSLTHHPLQPHCRKTWQRPPQEH